MAFRNVHGQKVKKMPHPMMHPPHSLKDSNVSLKMKTMEKRVGVMVPGSQHFGGKKGALEFGDGD
jgi:hypothetical protein